MELEKDNGVLKERTRPIWKEKETVWGNKDLKRKKEYELEKETGRKPRIEEKNERGKNGADRDVQSKIQEGLWGWMGSKHKWKIPASFDKVVNRGEERLQNGTVTRS